MKPVLDSVDAIACDCEKVLSEMTCEPITGEHYNTLEVRREKRSERLRRKRVAQTARRQKLIVVVLMKIIQLF